MRRRRRQAGFSFTEIMFAVIILGVGFIMVAAIFPVAIQQAKSTTEETTAASIARGGTRYISGVIADGVTPVSTSNCAPSQAPEAQTAANVSFVRQPDTKLPAAPGVPLWQASQGNLILPDDSRYAFVYLYRRDGLTANATTWSPYVQVFVFPVQARATATFTANDLKVPTTGVPAGTPANLMARPVRVAIADNVATAGGVDLIAFDRTMGAADVHFNSVNAAVEGAYVVIADDKISGADQGLMNGRIFKLGARRTDLDAVAGLFGNTGIDSNKVVYELQPGNDFARDPGANGSLYGPGNTADNDDIVAIGNSGAITGSNSSTVASGSAEAFVIGRGYSPNAPLGTAYDGPCMAISAYTTFLKVN